MSQARIKPLSEDDYLAFEAASALKHEFVGARVYAMAGASANHNRIAGNLYAKLLGSAPSDCQVFISDMKLRADAGASYYYPDVMAACDPQDHDPYFRANPCLLVEVLSPATEAIDRREKLIAYQKLSSLREYLIMAQDVMRIELYRRLNAREWSLETLGADDVLTLDCIAISAPVAEFYRGVDFSLPR